MEAHAAPVTGLDLEEERRALLAKATPTRHETLASGLWFYSDADARRYRALTMLLTGRAPEMRTAKDGGTVVYWPLEMPETGDAEDYMETLEMDKYAERDEYARVEEDLRRESI